MSTWQRFTDRFGRFAKTKWFGYSTIAGFAAFSTTAISPLNVLADNKKNQYFVFEIRNKMVN